MQKLLIGIAMLSLFVGCATARLPQSPDIYSLQRQASQATVLVTKVVDGRGSMKAGMIGGASIQVKKEIVEFSTSHLMSALNKNLSLNIIPTNSLSSGDIAKTIQSNQADGAVVATIRSLKMHSFDAVMEPVEVNMSMDVVVYDKNGAQLTATSVLGRYEKRIGITIVDKSTGELVGNTVKNVMDNLVKDSKIKQAIQQLK